MSAVINLLTISRPVLYETMETISIIAGTIGIKATACVVNMATQLFIKFLGGSPFLITCNSLFFWLGLGIGSIFWAYLSDKFRVRKIFILLILPILANILYLLSLTNKIYFLFLLIFIFAFFAGGFNPCISAFILERAQNKLKGVAISKFTTSLSIGWGIGAILCGFLLKNGFHFTYKTMIISIIIALLSIILLKEKKVPNPIIKEEKITHYPLLISVLLRKIGIMGLWSIIFVYMQIKNIPPHIMGILVSSNDALQIVLMPLCGRLSDIVDKRRFSTLGIFLSIFPPIIMAMANSKIMFLLGFINIAISWSILLSGTITFIGNRNTKIASSVAYFWLVDSLGGIIGPFIAGIIANLTNNYQYTFFSMSFIILIGLIFALKHR